MPSKPMIAVLTPVLIFLSGCAIDQSTGSMQTGAIKSPSEKSSARSRDETLKSFCAQRHVDYQTGKAPGGATSNEKKVADDRLCEAISRQG